MSQAEEKKAVVLLSGGLDSATVLAVARDSGCRCFCLSFRYGQRHEQEIEAARRIAEILGAERHLVLDIDLGAIGGSSLTTNAPIPKDRSADEIPGPIPSTYVPARNTLFLAHALAWAEVLDCRNIFIGVNALDFSGYPDCRPDYIEAFEKMARLATRMGTEGKKEIRVRTPLIAMTKAQIIKKGLALGVDFGLTHSCYDPAPDGRACGRCDSCVLRKKGFAEAGEKDPIEYEK